MWKITKAVVILVTLQIYHTNAEKELFSKKYTDAWAKLSKKSVFWVAWSLEIRHAFHSEEGTESFVYQKSSFLKRFKNLKGMVLLINCIQECSQVTE